MKATLLFCAMVAMIVLSCAPQRSSPIEGAWKAVHSISVKGDSLTELPGKWTGTQLKMWSKGHFSFVGRFNIDTTVVHSYGGGRYTLEGNRYAEIIEYHITPSRVGTTVNMLMEVRGDTLTQTWPAGDDGQIDKTNYRAETYVRLD